MKKNILIISLLSMTAMLVSCVNQSSKQEKTALAAEEDQQNQLVKQDTIKGSIPSEAKGSIGSANVSVNYHAPGVKGRILWGGLVPYDQVWVTGAHMATRLEFDSDLLIGEQKVPAGKYALFTIPGREEWTVIINKNWEQHLTDEYDQKKDILRMQVKPTVLQHHQERLKYEINELSEGEGTLNISWDKLMVALPVRITS